MLIIFVAAEIFFGGGLNYSTKLMNSFRDEENYV